MRGKPGNKARRVQNESKGKERGGRGGRGEKRRKKRERKGRKEKEEEVRKGRRWTRKVKASSMFAKNKNFHCINKVTCALYKFKST